MVVAASSRRFLRPSLAPASGSFQNSVHTLEEVLVDLLSVLSGNQHDERIVVVVLNELGFFTFFSYRRRALATSRRLGNRACAHHAPERERVHVTRGIFRAAALNVSVPEDGLVDAWAASQHSRRKAVGDKTCPIRRTAMNQHLRRSGGL